MNRGLRPLAGWALLIAAAGCHRGPPPSRFPSADLALTRVREEQACSRAVGGDAKLDYFGEQGRVRGSVLYVAAAPDRIRFDVFSPFGATLSTLTSDGRRFALSDVRERVFLHGPANACNLQRFTRVPLPPQAFVDLLRGVPPVLVHDASAASLEWESGAYSVRIRSRHQAEQKIRLLPAEEDWNRPWREQRLRVMEVEVRQAGAPLYRVELEGHARVRMAETRVDPDGIDPPFPPSGPECHAELPRRFHFVVGDGRHDVVLANEKTEHNPPLMPGTFEQTPAPGLRVRSSPCAE